MSSSMYQQGLKALAARGSRTSSLQNPDQRVSLDNPLCGDRVELELNIEAGRVTAIATTVRGCLLCNAAANLVAEAALGLSRTELESIEAALVAVLKGQGSSNWPPAGWQDLALFEPVSQHKSRHSCVTLPFTALLSGMSSQ